MTDRPGLSIREAAELLGVPAPTIRSWERRYRLLGPRTSGGHRRYGEPDLRLIARLRDEIAGGLPAAEAAALAKASAAVRPDLLIDAIVTAAADLDPGTIIAVADRSARLLDVDRTVEEVLLPALRAIGQAWATGGCGVAHEHEATSALTGWLHSRRHTITAAASRGPVLLGCGPDELHTVGLEALALLLTSRGIACHVLGAQTPADALVSAVGQLGPEAVVVSAQLRANRRSALQAIRAAAGTGCRTYYGGAAFDEAGAVAAVAATYLGASVRTAAARIDRDLAALPR
jgi:excisionase family DNA binding protein